MKLDNVTKRSYADACGAALALDIVGERWALLVVRELLLGPRRFGELRRGLAGISANVLTQRLHGLIEEGVVEQRRLGPPANATVYALTPWGREAEPVVLALGRWALRSPRHDPSLPFSTVSLLLSMRMLAVPERVAGLDLRIDVSAGGEPYRAHVADGAVAVATGHDPAATAAIEGLPNAFLPVLYGGMPLAAAERAGMLAVAGDRTVAERFVTLFALPAKTG